MRIGGLFRESWKNLRSRPFIGLSLLVASFGGTALVTLSEIRSVAGIFEAQRTLVEEGFYTLHITQLPESSASAPPLHARDCTKLNDIVGVLSAGGAESLDGLRLGAAAGPVLNGWAVEPKVLGVASWSVAMDTSEVAWDRHGSVYDWRVAERFGGVEAEAEMTVFLSGEPYAIEAVKGNTGVLGGGLREATLIGANLDEIDVCIVISDPQHRDQVELQAVSLLPGTMGYQASWSLIPDSTFQSPIERLESRNSRFGGVIVGILLSLLSGAIMLSRRHDAATYRLLGLSGRHTSGLYALEELFPMALGGAAGAAMAAILAIGAPTAALAAGLVQLGVLVAFTTMGLVAVAVALASQNVVGALKDL